MLSMLCFIEHGGHGRYRMDKTDINSPCSSQVKRWESRECRKRKKRKKTKNTQGKKKTDHKNSVDVPVQNLQNANNITRQSKRKMKNSLALHSTLFPKSHWLLLKQLMKQLLNSTLAELWQQGKRSLICKNWRDKRTQIKQFVITDSTRFSSVTLGIEYAALFLRALKYCCWKKRRLKTKKGHVFFLIIH